MPFGDYKDFDDCVAKNKDKKDPKAYCASIERKIKDKEHEEVKEHRISEVFESFEGDFTEDQETGALRSTNVIIRAGTSKNGRHYSPNVLKEAVKNKIWDGTRMFVDHSNTPPLKRKFNEMVSAVESTSWDENRQAVMGNIEYFDQGFYERAKRAQRYMGNSINALVRGTRHRVPQGDIKEEVHQIVKGHSVDWVIFPSAGGEIVAFESEGDEEVDWESITLEDLQEHAPQLLEQFKSTLSEGESDDDSDESSKAIVTALTAEQIADIIDQRLTAREKEKTKTEGMKKIASEKLRDLFSKSGLPERTRARLMASYEGVTEVDEDVVKEAIEDAKEELKAAGAGPKIKDMGGSAPKSGDETPKVGTVRESVEAAFGKKPSTSGDAES